MFPRLGSTYKNSFEFSLRYTSYVPRLPLNINMYVARILESY